MLGFFHRKMAVMRVRSYTHIKGVHPLCESRRFVKRKGKGANRGIMSVGHSHTVGHGGEDFYWRVANITLHSERRLILSGARRWGLTGPSDGAVDRPPWTSAAAGAEEAN